MLRHSTSVSLAAHCTLDIHLLELNLIFNHVCVSTIPKCVQRILTDFTDLVSRSILVDYFMKTCDHVTFNFWTGAYVNTIITLWCGRKQLSWDQREEVFSDLCLCLQRDFQKEPQYNQPSSAKLKRWAVVKCPKLCIELNYLSRKCQ